MGAIILYIVVVAAILGVVIKKLKDWSSIFKNKNK